MYRYAVGRDMSAGMRADARYWLWSSKFMSETMSVPSLLTCSTYATCPNEYHATSPTRGELSAAIPAGLAAAPQVVGLPQRNPDGCRYQLVKAMPREFRRQAT